jgi:hypothetical protein
VRSPITSYKEDPEKNRLAEYHEVNYALDAKMGGFVLLDMHGWWEHEKGAPYFNRKVLCEPQQSEGHASVAMDERVRSLEKQGWTHKFTTEFDSATGMLQPKRI